MKNYFQFFIVMIITFSCVDNSNVTREKNIYNCLPRKVNYMTVAVEKRIITYYSGGYSSIKYSDVEGNTVNKDEFVLSVWTCNCRPDTLQDLNLYPKILDNPIPEVEKLLIQDYDKTSNQQNTGLSKGTDAMNFIDIEYRTSVVRNLTIFALSTSLFGKSSGESLNEFFDIKGYNPAIISTPNYRLIYGLANHNSIEMPIGEWLSINPLAEESMYLAPNKPLTGLPLDVQFVLEMETDEGLVLRDTTQVFTITE